MAGSSTKSANSSLIRSVLSSFDCSFSIELVAYADSTGGPFSGIVIKCPPFDTSIVLFGLDSCIEIELNRRVDRRFGIGESVMLRCDDIESERSRLADNRADFLGEDVNGASSIAAIASDDCDDCELVSIDIIELALNGIVSTETLFITLFDLVSFSI